ncbi:isocitrate/isopropylmalate family dehydrogenase [Kitasatospora sp. MAP5-34]|uniref:isocitrate/isopropylmalate family dehydrogenase n=1 Tax=Kitasatospora sp. MAP5-34 TaxID=3035102 RepID=UPI0024772BC1|nr:isocitrate/isopropylmalate family dehydrogenase [Kitasatospora sp. MAP5-34]MDH6580337.1 molybdenum cofactor synthesis domain-containing protein [Kitasatospora sp. MAP5-34]
MTPTKKIAVLPGDGIGREVVDAALPVLDVLGVPVELIHGDIGWNCWQREGDPVPQRTWDLLAATDTCLLGAITSKPLREAEADLDESLRGRGLRYVSPVIQLRQRLGLYANVRPVENHLGRGRPYRFAVIRENTEGLYAGFDYAGATVPDAVRQAVAGHPNVSASGVDGSAVSLRLLTRHGLERLIRFAFDYAREHGHTLVTWADKPNVLRESGNFAREVLERIAADYPGITAEVHNVDAVALWMVRRPERFGVIVAENMFGDILSDLGGGVMGGLGLAPSGNIGASGSYFEPVHGSAPHLAGRDRANPAAMVLTLGMMLDHLGLHEAAREIPRAVRSVLRRGEVLTYDLGGSGGTAEVAAAIVAACTDRAAEPTAAVLTVGDELLTGEVLDTNAGQAAKLLRTHGFRARARRTVGDGQADISTAVQELLGNELLVVIGGLGPTSDDRTRHGVAQALGVRLDHSPEAWSAVVERLERFGLVVHPDNERQALFPAASELLPNENGTAWGSVTEHGDTRVVMLPGPPRECLPMLRALLEKIAPAKQQPEWPRWRTLGLIESDVAAAVDQAIAAEGVRLAPAYRWNYPYVDISLPVRLGTHPQLEQRITELLDGHVVSRRGLTAAEELAELAGDVPVVELDDRLTDGRAEKLFGSRYSSGPGAAKVTVRARAEGAEPEPDGWTGSLAMEADVTVAGATRSYRLSAPRRGPEVFDFAAEFVAWSVLRALTEEGSTDADH